MKLIYVNVPVISTELKAFMVTDDADLKVKLKQHEDAFRLLPVEYKMQRDEKGKPLFHQLNKDWPQYP